MDFKRLSAQLIRLALLLLLTLACKMAQPSSFFMKTSPATSTPEEVQHIDDLVEQNLITVNITGVGIDALAVHVRSNSADPLELDIPAGTYFVAQNPSVQNMVVRHPFSTTIEPHAEMDIILDAACANLHRAEPGKQDTFAILGTSEQPELTKIINKLNSAEVDYPVEQAAIWIVTDNATYDELGMLVGGSRFGAPIIKENETVHAMLLIDEAGIDILKKAIWQDRELMTPNVTEPDLIAWLDKRGSTATAQPTPARSNKASISQFAISATASSEFTATDWSAMQAVGAPNTSKCGDLPTAWSSAHKNPGAWLLLTYAQPVIPTRIVIYQTYNPGAVFYVEVIDTAGNASAVYQANATIISDCPYAMEIDVTDVDTPVSSIRIDIDQSNIGWSEIDAVELIGRPN